MNYLVELGIKLIPILSILFVILLILVKIYMKIRSRYNILVNCWFCNENTKVLFIDRNSWTCPNCQQYNGFDDDGNYNKEIREQFDITKNKIFNMTNTSAIGLNFSYRSSSFHDDEFPSNGFCFDCNENQRIKIEKLGQFEPKKESKFNDELKTYKSQLEQQYRLCSTCERHLKKVLREKKKMVLGSKLLDFIVRGTQKIQRHSKLKNLKSTPFKYIKVLISLTILFLGIIDFCLVIHGVSDKQHGSNALNDPFVQGIIIFASYFSESLNFIKPYIDLVFKHHFVHKIFLYIRTLIIMASHFFGIKVPNFSNLNHLILTSMPFCGIFLSFIHNALDRFHLTRTTILLTIWSFQAAVSNTETFQRSKIFELITATCIMILSIPHWNSDQLMNESDSSFHKMYSTENYYLHENEDEEEDSISLQSSNLNLSNNSYRSTGYRSLINHGFNTQRTSSSLNLNKFGLKSSLRQISSKGNLFTSNLELNRPDSVSNMTHNSSFCCGLINNSVNKTVPGVQFDNQKFSSTDYNDPNIPKNDFSIGKIPAPMYSPFSQYSVCSYNGRQPILTPSRFGHEIDINSHHSLNTSWLSGGYFNQKKDSPYQQKREHDSRSSSLSSGFESNSSNFISTQLHNNKDVSRENSYCTDNNIHFHNNIFSHLSQASLGNCGPDQCHLSQWNSFRPISQSMLNLNNNDLRATNFINSDIDWRRSRLKEFSPLPRNMFNLNKINEELPPVMKRNSLLRNYHEQNSLFES